MLPSEWIWDTSLSVFLPRQFLWTTVELADTSDYFDWLAYGVLWESLFHQSCARILFPFFLLWLALRAQAHNSLSANSLFSLRKSLYSVAPLDHPQLRPIPPPYSPSLQSSFRTRLGNNDIFDEHAVGVSAHHTVR